MRITYLLIATLVVFMLMYTISSNKALAQVGQIWETIIGEPAQNIENQEAPADQDVGEDKDFGAVPGCNNIEQRLKDDFGVTVRSGGDRSWCGSYVTGSPQTVDCAIRQNIWKSLARPAKSAGFRKNLKKWNPWTVQCFTHAKGSAYSNGCVSSSSVMNIGNCAFSKSYPTIWDRHFLHETGHILKARNTRKLYQGFPVSTLASKDGACYDGLFIKTYSLRSTDARSESMAEATMLYVYNDKSNPDTGTITNFRRQCDDTYRWTRDKVYEDYEF